MSGSVRAGPCAVDADCGALLVCIDGTCEAGSPAAEPSSTGEAGASSSGHELDAPVVACGVTVVELDGDRTEEILTFEAAYSSSRCVDAPGPSAAFLWTAPDSADYVADVRLSSAYWALGLPEPIVTAYDATCSTELGCGNSQSGDRTFTAFADQPIVLMVEGLVPGIAYADDYGFTLQVGPVPAATDYPMRTTITRELGADDRIHAPACDGGGRGEGPEVAFRWTAPELDTYVFYTADADFDSMVSVVDGRSPAASQVACGEEIVADSGRSAAVARVAQGEEVFVVVDSNDDEGGRFELGIEPAFGCVGEKNEIGAGEWPALGIISERSNRQALDFPADFPGKWVLFRYTAPADGRYGFSVADATENFVNLALLGSCKGPVLAAYLGPGDEEESGRPRVGTALRAGESVLLAVEHLEDETLTVRQRRLECSTSAGPKGSDFFAREAADGACSPADDFLGFGEDDLAFRHDVAVTGFYEVEVRVAPEGGDEVAVTVTPRAGRCGGRQLACGSGTYTWAGTVRLSPFFARAGDSVQIVIDGGEFVGADVVLTEALP